MGERILYNHLQYYQEKSVVMKAILFDLDGTLLPMDQELFVKAYLKRLAGFMMPHGYDPEKLVQVIWACTGAMVKNTGKQINERIFWNDFEAMTGKDRSSEEGTFLQFYQTEFQKVQESCGRNPLAAETIRALKEMGYQLILATNPLFPQIATYSRIRWAGLSPEDFIWVTTYENSSFSKPNPDYYREILSKMELKPEDCLMVGNDAEEDMIAGTLGMKTFLMTECLINKYSKDINPYPKGGFPELMDYIRSEC